MDNKSVIEKKRALRREILAVRDAVSDKQRKLESSEVCRKVKALESYRNADRLLAFASYGSEIETAEIIEDALNAGKEVYLPKVEGEQMRFYRIASMDALQEGYKGIREPVPSPENLLRKRRGAFLLMPGVVFDREGCRIGYGKGFYDRFLAEEDENMYVCAIALDCQIVENGRIAMEETDRRIAHILTASEEIVTAR